MTAPRPEPPNATHQPGVFALRLGIVVVGGWVITTILRGLLNSRMEGNEAQAIAAGGILTMSWYALIIYEAHKWWVAARGGRRIVPAAGSAGERKGKLPLFGSASVGASILVWIWVHEVFYTPYTGPGGESALIGFAAAGFLCVVALLAGVAAGVASLVMKERRWVGLVGIVCNLGTAAALAWLVSQA